MSPAPGTPLLGDRSPPPTWGHSEILPAQLESARGDRERKATREQVSEHADAVCTRNANGSFSNRNKNK